MLHSAAVFPKSSPTIGSGYGQPRGQPWALKKPGLFGRVVVELRGLEPVTGEAPRLLSHQLTRRVCRSIPRFPACLRSQLDSTMWQPLTS